MAMDVLLLCNYSRKGDMVANGFLELSIATSASWKIRSRSGGKKPVGTRFEVPRDEKTVEHFKEELEKN